MEYVNIKDTDISVSKMALGTWVFSNDRNWGYQDDNLSIKTIHKAIDSGITLFDTAPAYGDGHSERVLAKALKGKRNDLIIATKIAHHSPDKKTVISECEKSLKRLETDVIDIYQLHWPRRTVSFHETMQGLLKLYQDGKIRAVGVCNFGELDLSEMMKYGKIHTNQLAYNPIFRPIDRNIRPLCIKNDISILCYSPLAQGLCTGKYKSIEDIPERLKRVWYLDDEYKEISDEMFRALLCIEEISKENNISMAALSIAYSMRKQGTASVLVGARNIQQLDQNMKAADFTPSKDIMALMDLCTDKLYKMIYNADMWRVDSAIR